MRTGRYPLVMPCMSTALALLLVTAASAQSTERQPAKAINSLIFPEIAAVTLLHLAADAPARQETGKRMSDAVIISGALATLIQETTRSARPAPHDADKHAFPSGHASLAFAAAASLSTREPRATWIAYPLAAAAAWAREDLGWHTWAQVIGGVALGTFIGRQCGQGKLTIFGHNDSELPPSLTTAESSNPPHAVGPATQMRVWGTGF